MRPKAVMQTKVSAGTQTSLIVSQIVVAAALAVPLGLFAAAAGIIAARGQGGQVRVAFYTNTSVTASPSPTPSSLAMPPRTGTLAAPTRLAVVERLYNTVGLRWDAPSGAEGFDVYNGNRWVASFFDVQDTYQVNGLDAGTLYYFFVVAFNDYERSAPAGPLSAVTEQPVAPDCNRSDSKLCKQRNHVKQCPAQPADGAAAANDNACVRASSECEDFIYDFSCPAVSGCEKYCKGPTYKSWVCKKTQSKDPRLKDTFTVECTYEASVVCATSKPEGFSEDCSAPK